MSDTTAYLVWLAALVGWVLIRMPHRRTAKRKKIAVDRKSLRERLALGLCVVALSVMPFIAWAGFLPFADVDISLIRGLLGALVLAGFLLLFHLSHRQLADNWSVTLELREGHRLVTHGLYAHMRHPMYSAFLLWGLGQGLVVPNWLAGWAGLAAVVILYVSRIREEEAMMRERFGAEYDAYADRTARLLPGVY